MLNELSQFSLLLIIGGGLASLAIISWLGTRRNHFLFQEKLAEMQRENILAVNNASHLRQEVTEGLRHHNEALVNSMSNTTQLIQNQLQVMLSQQNQSTESHIKAINKLQESVQQQLNSIQESNSKKLDEMRHTVDEKLQSTLEKRLTESFSRVSERLEAVQRGLGEMQQLAVGVGDLKRIFSNVKTRGSWGEVQLGEILAQSLSDNQYQKNVGTGESNALRMDYAIVLPGATPDHQSYTLLPIDSKFPIETYERLLTASEDQQDELILRLQKDLHREVKTQAKAISEKYIKPPQTTDFAILFLPTENLYAEVLRLPGLVSDLQNRYGVMIAGPTTLIAILNSLRMGFRSLAIQQHSGEVWKILGTIKLEFDKFGEVLVKLKKQLDTASGTLENDVHIRSRAMQRKLQSIEQLPTKSNISEPPTDNNH